MKKFLYTTITLLLSAIGTQAQTVNYSFLDWAPENSEAEYVSVLDGEAVEVSSGATGCFVELATFAGHELNKRFAFASEDMVTLSADNGLLVKNNAGKKNTTIAILGLQEGDKVTVEYSSSNEIQVTSANAYYEKADGTTVIFSKLGKNNANKLVANTDGANGGTEFTFTMTKSGSLDLLSATTAGSIRLWNVTIIHPTDRRAAFVFNSTYPGYDSEYDHLLLNYVQENTDALAEIEFVDIDLSKTTVGAMALRDYELVILSSAIAGDEPQAETLRQAVAYVPMLNLSTNLYPAWGYAKQQSTGTNVVTLSTTTHELFASHNFEVEIAEDGTMPFLNSGGDIRGYTEPGEYFAADQVLASAGDVNVIHVHNSGRNAYLLLPFMLETMEYVPEFVGDLLPNAINYVKKTLRTVTKTATPEASLAYENLQTKVTLTCATTGALTWIYYTTDGTEPTEQSQRYTEPILISQAGQVVRAIARTDGYEQSDVLTTDVIDLRQQVKTPGISITRQDKGQTTVELSCSTPGATIYYNYTGSNKPMESAPYTGPVTLKHMATLTALATVEGMVNSEAAELFIPVDGVRVRIDTLAWMNSHDKAYGSGDLVKQYNYWSTEKVDSVGTPMTYDDGTPILDENNEPMISWTFTYAPADSLTYKDFGNGWAIGSYGQRINNQVNNGTGNIGTGEYGPATVDDYGFTRGAMSFLVCKTANDPATAWIQTTEKHQAPFDIAIWLTGQQTEGLNNEVELSVSTDNETWTVIDTVNTTLLKNVEKFVRSYDGTDEVYFKARSVNHNNTTQQKTLIFDILLLNHGTLSAQYGDDSNGVSERRTEGRVVSTVVFNATGMKTGRMARGVNIVRETYENGVEKIHKVIVK